MRNLQLKLILRGAIATSNRNSKRFLLEIQNNFLKFFFYFFVPFFSSFLSFFLFLFPLFSSFFLFLFLFFLFFFLSFFLLRAIEKLPDLAKLLKNN